MVVDGVRVNSLAPAAFGDSRAITYLDAIAVTDPIAPAVANGEP
jgi:hypothetical protein